MSIITMDHEYPIIIPYKINRSIESTGRHLAITKRHYRCRFGFAHISSILQGEAGVGCRGVEMDIHVIWSIASGKREIHFNKNLLYHDVAPNRGVNRFDHTFSIPEFTLAGGHIIHITALTFAFNEAEQFVITVNGQSYDEFLNIYELGGPSMYQIYGVLIENYARYRRGTTQRLQLSDRVDHNENIADRAKYLPSVPEEAKLKDAKNYSMMPTSKKEARKMMALAVEQSLQDPSTNNKVHHSAVERLSSIRTHRLEENGIHNNPFHYPPPQALISSQPPVVVDLLGLNSDSIHVQATSTASSATIPRESTSDQVLLSFLDNYDTHNMNIYPTESKHRAESYTSSFSVASSMSGRDTPMMFSAPPPAWETLQRDFSFSFASPPNTNYNNSHQSVFETKH